MICLKITDTGEISKYDAPDLKALQDAVGGYIEYIPLSFCDMIVNEEGLYVCEHRNLFASLIVSAEKMYVVEIKGNVLLVGPATPDGKSTDFTDKLADILFSKFSVLKAGNIWNR